MLIVQPYSYSVIVILLSLAVALFAYTRWRIRKTRPTAGIGSLLLFCASFWMLANAFEVASTDAASALRWFQMEHIIISLVPILWLLLTLQFVGKEHWITPLRLVLLTLIPAFCLAALLSDTYRHWFFSSAALEIHGAISKFEVEESLLMIVFYTYGYLLVITGGVLVSHRLVTTRGFVWQGSAVLLGVAFTVVANIIDLSPLSQLPHIRLTPFAVVLSIAIFAAMVMRTRRADILPIARGRLTHLMSDAVLVLDVECRIIDLNPPAEKLLGHSARQVLGQRIPEAWPEWPRQFGGPLDESLHLKEMRIAGPQGEAVYDIRLSYLDNKKGEHIGRLVVLRDITERAKAEKAVQLSEEYFRSLIENASDLIVVVDESAGIRYVSPSLVRNFGYALDAILGRCSLEFVHPEDFAAVASALAEAVLRAGISPPVIARFRHADGTWRKLECVVNNLIDQPAVHGLVVNARDVTEREAVAEALRESEERYRLHFANINDVVYSYDASMRITSVSPSVERILGIRVEDVIGTSLSNLRSLGIVPPEFLEKAVTEARQLLAGESIVNTRYEFIARDGSRRIAEISSNPIVQHGRVIGAVNVARDVTERVQAEKRIRDSLEEKEVLLREIHHRVKNNLQIVSSLLNLQSATVEAPEIRTLFRDSQNRISSMALIHERLYRSEDFARIDFGTYLRDLTRHLMQSYQTADNRIRLSVEIADDIHLDIDTAIPCGLVTSELVSNALKHAFPGQARGTVGVEMRQLADSQIELIVWDDGRGFSPEIAARNSMSLGVQLIRRLTSQIGGRVEYDTTHGTRAVIRFQPTRVNPPAATR